MIDDCPVCGEPRPPVRIGELEVSLLSGASWRGVRLRVGGQKLAALHSLARAQGRVVSRHGLAMAAMPDDAEDKRLDVLVCRLRRTLADAAVPFTIETAWGRGHRLVPLGDPSENRAPCIAPSKEGKRAQRAPDMQSGG